MAGGDSVIWLRVEDEDIDAAGSTEWPLEEEKELRPQFPDLEDH